MRAQIVVTGSLNIVQSAIRVIIVLYHTIHKMAAKCSKVRSLVCEPMKAEHAAVMPFQRQNHYVPCVYLKGFAGPDRRVRTYRLLVPHPQVPLWKAHSARSIGYHSYLYTRLTAGGPTDEIEKWLEREFETPATEALERAVSDGRLTRSHWNDLIRFVAAQDVRTPARLLDNLRRGHAELPGVLNEVLQDAVADLQRAKARGTVPVLPSNDSDDIPFRLTKSIEPGQAFGTLKGEVVAGRGLWLFSIKHTLTQTINVLHQHRWSILTPPDGLSWFTSDDPVIRLNYYPNGTYDFRGGWGNPGSEILLPLSPRHLLYTKIGARPPSRGQRISRPHADIIRRFIAEHAHRMIFAAFPDEEVPTLRPRLEHQGLFRSEAERWRQWHDEQTAVERTLRGWS